MTSFLSWLDYSERERKHMLDVISRFRDRETRDELGIGSVRDVFADIFFPGTSTIQTRARYFLFIPWMYLRLESKHSLSGNAAQLARSEETKLIYGLLKSGEKEGVIGSDAKEKLQRLPSNIYWHGLGIWGIRLFKGTQSQYDHYLDRYHSISQQNQYNDDGEPIDGRKRYNWHPDLPSIPKEFPESCDFQLTHEEARYIQEKINAQLHDTLLAFLAENGRACESIDYPWEHPQFASFPDKIQTQLEHARNFSEAIYGASLLYNLMLAEAARDDKLQKLYREKMREWAVGLISKRYDVLVTWFKQIDRFWEIVQTPSVRIPSMTKQFIMRWLTLVFAPGAAIRIVENADARRLIRERERQLKRSLARLDNPRTLELWNGAAGDSRLDYRWGITQTLLNDILQGLGRNSHVASK
jgi:hypothetical protein